MNYLTLVQVMQVLRMLLDIIIVWIILYYLIKVVRSNARTTQIFKGIFIVIIVNAFAKQFGFDTLSYLSDNVIQWGFLALIVIFQPEIRGILEKVGKTNVFSRINTLSGGEKEDLVQALMDAASNLSESKTGALITIEQSESLANYSQTGIQLNSIVTAELLCSIFQTTTPLHDGAVIIQGDRIAAASVYFPPTQLDLPSRYGARHRAAIGISEVSDAVTIVVSEETGRVAIAEQGKLIKMNERKLRSYLNRVILNRETVADEKITPMSSRSVSIDALFEKEAAPAMEAAAAEKAVPAPVTPVNVAPGQTKVVIIDESADEDEDNTPIVHKAEMKTFIQQDFKSDTDTITGPVKAEEIRTGNRSDKTKTVEVVKTPKRTRKTKTDEAAKEQPKAAESAKGSQQARKPLFQFLRKDKKSPVEKAVSEVTKDYTTQQIKLKEIAEANERAEAEKKARLQETPKVNLPKAEKTTRTTARTTNTNTNTEDKTESHAAAAPAVPKVKTVKLDIPSSPEIKVKDLPPVPAVAITKIHLNDEKEDENDGE